MTRYIVGLRCIDSRPKPSGLRNRKIDKAALMKHVEDHPDMFLHERAEIFDVHPSSISRALKTLGIVKKNEGITSAVLYSVGTGEEAQCSTL